MRPLFCSLFVDETKLSAQSRKHLNLDSTTTTPETVELRPYKMIKDFMKWLVTQDNGKIWVRKLVNLCSEKESDDFPEKTTDQPEFQLRSSLNHTGTETGSGSHTRNPIQSCEK